MHFATHHQSNLWRALSCWLFLPEQSPSCRLLRPQGCLSMSAWKAPFGFHRSAKETSEWWEFTARLVDMSRLVVDCSDHRAASACLLEKHPSGFIDLPKRPQVRESSRLDESLDSSWLLAAVLTVCCISTVAFWDGFRKSAQLEVFIYIYLWYLWIFAYIYKLSMIFFNICEDMYIYICIIMQYICIYRELYLQHVINTHAYM